MTFHVHAPNRDTIFVGWSSTFQLTPQQRTQLVVLPQFPGIRVEDTSIKVPANLLDVPAVCRSLYAFGVDKGALEAAHKSTVDTFDASQLWQPLRPSFDYQAEEALNVIRARRRLVAFDMGVGKSQTSAQAAETVRQRYHGRPVVIIGPLFAQSTWRRELFATGAIESASELCTLKTRDLKHASWNPKANYIFCHYDVLDAWWSKINLRQPCFAIVDEGHRIKNSRTLRGKAAMMVAGAAPYCAILTGTPMENRPAELWHLLSILTNPFAFGSPLDFRKRYAGAEFNGYGYQDTVPTHVDELKQRLSTIYVRKTAEDVGLKLPPLTRNFVEIDPDGALTTHEGMSNEQMLKLTHAVRDNRVSEVLPLLTKLRKEASDRKVKTTVEVACNAIEQGEKIVVFTWMTAQAKKLATAIEKKGAKAHYITGEIAETQRAKMIEEFQAGTGDAIVATLGALKEGVTLHAARIVIMHDMDWVPATMRQAEKRVLRIGQKRPCIAYWMLCNRSVDQIFAGILSKKLVSIEHTLDEKVDGFEGLQEIVSREDSDNWNSRVAEWMEWK